MKVSVIIPCKNRLNHLQQTLPLVIKQDYEDLEIIVVDYNCPQKTWQWVAGLVSPKVNYVIADVEPNEWSLSAARNLGYKHSTGEMLFFLDADARLLQPDFISRNVWHCVDGAFVCGWGTGKAHGCMMLRRSAFEAVRGYNEAIRSWGYEDLDIFIRLQNQLAQERRDWAAGIETIEHGPEIRNFYHGGIDPMKTNEENYHIAQKEFKGI